MYRPNQHFLVILNSDGTGAVRQFNNEKDARDAYFAYPDQSATLYLYTTPARSLAEGEESDPPLFEFTTAFDDTQNETAENNVNHPNFEEMHPVFGTDACAGKPPFPRPASAGAGPNIDPQWDAWMNFCKVKPNCPACTSGNNPKFGTIIYDETQNEERPDVSGQTHTTQLRIVSKANGLGGLYNEYSSIYPQGYLEDVTNVDAEDSTYIIKGLDPALGPNSFVDMYSIDVLNWISRTRHTWDGNGALIQTRESGIPQASDSFLQSLRPLVVPQNGDTPVDLLGKPIGAPSGTGFPQSYNVDGVIYSGTWYPEITRLPLEYTVTWRFEPNQPDQPPPPFGSILKKVFNSTTGEDEYVPDNRAFYPTRVEDTQDVSIDINGDTGVVSVKVGERTRFGLNNNGVITYGEFLPTEYIEQGQLIHTDSNFNYFSDGQGGFTVEGKVCPTEGTEVSTGREPITITTICGVGQIGERDYTDYADGNCGTYRILGASYYTSMGYNIASCQYVNEYGVTVTKNYVSYGDGGYYDYDVTPQEYNYFGLDDDTGLPNQGPFYFGVPAEYENYSENGVGYGEAQLYDQNELSIAFESYDPISGEVQFSAGQSNIPQHGDWLRNSFGRIVYSTRRPRLVEVQLPEGLRTSTSVTVDSMGARPNGGTTIKVQVGWIYTGRKRFHSGLSRYIDADNESSFVGSPNLPVGSRTEDAVAILESGALCNLTSINEAGPKTFYEAVDTGQNGYAKYRFKNSTGWFVISNGDGTARLQKN